MLLLNKHMIISGCDNDYTFLENMLYGQKNPQKPFRFWKKCFSFFGTFELCRADRSEGILTTRRYASVAGEGDGDIFALLAPTETAVARYRAPRRVSVCQPPPPPTLFVHHRDDRHHQRVITLGGDGRAREVDVKADFGDRGRT